MSNKTSDNRMKPLMKMVGKEVKVLTEGGWRGRVARVLDEENILILKNSEHVKVNIYDIRSV